MSAMVTGILCAVLITMTLAMIIGLIGNAFAISEERSAWREYMAEVRKGYDVEYWQDRANAIAAEIVRLRMWRRRIALLPFWAMHRAAIYVGTTARSAKHFVPSIKGRFADRRIENDVINQQARDAA